MDYLTHLHSRLSDAGLPVTTAGGYCGDSVDTQCNTRQYVQSAANEHETMMRTGSIYCIKSHGINRKCNTKMYKYHIVVHNSKNYRDAHCHNCTLSIGHGRIYSYHYTYTIYGTEIFRVI